MDCNREEAVRAKELAEKKMEIKDFSGALKIAVKAQQLYPELENISQLILVCEVHCSAEKKSYGTDKDWYGILKVEPSADDASIKKQYRKLALILHPDKNKFSGSTDAFKLIGEAQRVLLDREKRMIHDSKRRAFGNISSNISSPKWTPVNFTGGRPGNVQFAQQRAPTGVGGYPSTFWTVCPYCSVRYQFYRDVVNKAINCQACKKFFTAFELNAPTQTQTRTQNHNGQHQNRVSPKPAQGGNRKFTTKPVFEKKEPVKKQGNVNRKRKQTVESSESADSSESDPEEDNRVPNNNGKNPDDSDFQYFGEQPRRSSRSKRNVSYTENVNDIDMDTAAVDGDDDGTPANPADKRAKKEQVFENKKAGSDNEKSQKDKPSSDDDNDDEDDTDEEIEQELFECPDPEFSDFEKERKEESFSVGQIWACYDTVDAMPRFYALIKKISPGFKLQIQWLKPDPVNADEKKWADEELPVSCGRFKHGKPDKSQDLLSFSHLVSWEAGQKPKTLSIVPRKGETWAVFKNWSMNWPSDEDDEERKYEYEFVEILSTYDEKAGVRVSYMEKVKGFVCLFMRKEGDEMVIAAHDKYRFAHMIPSCRMSGAERDGVPKGSYELDPAALPESAFGR